MGHQFYFYNHGKVAEWFKASVLKTDEGNSSMSSNLILTANLINIQLCKSFKIQLYIIIMKEDRNIFISNASTFKLWGLKVLY